MEDLIQKIARLESLNDQLQTELEYINELAIKMGFEKGLITLKAAALELIEDQDGAHPEDGKNPPLAG